MDIETADRLAAIAATAPRVSLASIRDKIKACYYFTGAEAVGPNRPAMPELASLSICIIVMKNGWTVLGKSAPASPANFDPDLGMRLAREDAERQLWPLEGYLLRNRLYGSEQAGMTPDSMTEAYLAREAADTD